MLDSTEDQFGYVYLQPKDKSKAFLIPAAVATALNGKKNSLPAYDSPWPNYINTNFRFCFVNYDKPHNTNYGHSEFQLLTGNALGEMAASVGCPKYVIVYSSNLPCYKPENPNPDIPRCAELTVQVKNNFAQTCPGATFYLYTDKESGKNLPDQNKLNFLLNSGIVWIHKDMNSPLTQLV